MPSYKLTYFDLKARAELSRYLFAVAGVEYEDVRVPYGQPFGTPSKEWLELKPKTLFGQLPQLEVDGKILTQSHTIERYLAREFGLAGKTSFEQAQADMIIESLADLGNSAAQFMFVEQDDTKKAELKKTYATETLPKFLAVYEKLLTANGSGFIVGNSMTVADLSIANYQGWTYTALGKDCADEAYKAFPEVVKLIKRVEGTPQLAKYIENRPKTMM